MPENRRSRFLFIMKSSSTNFCSLSWYIALVSKQYRRRFKFWREKSGASPVLVAAVYSNRGLSSHCNTQDSKIKIAGFGNAIQPPIFCIEGAESTLLKHLALYLDLEKNCELKMKTKILASVDHIRQRFFNRWDYIQFPFPNKSGKVALENYTESEQIKECVFQFLSFCEYLQQNTLGTLKTITLNQIAQEVPELIPAPSTLDSVLDSAASVDVSQLIEYYRQIPQTLLWRDNVWPLTSELVPEFILKGETFETT